MASYQDVLQNIAAITSGVSNFTPQQRFEAGRTLLNRSGAIPSTERLLRQGTALSGLWNVDTGGLSSFTPQQRLAGANSLLADAGLLSNQAVTPAPAPMPAAAAASTAGSVPAAAAQGGLTGRLGQLVGQLGGAAQPTWLSQRLAGQSTQGLGLRSMARGSLGRAGGLALLGQLAGAGVESAFGDPNASWDNALASGARWGGAGAALGSLIAPGVGTAIGGLAGAGFGAVKGILDSRDEGDKAVRSELAKQQGKIAELLSQLGSSPDLREEAMFQLRVLASQATDRKGVQAAAEAVQAMLPDALMADREMQRQQRMRQANEAAVQAWMGPVLQQLVNRSQSYADAFTLAGLNAAQQIEDPQLRTAQMAMARQYSADQAAQNAAYAAQIMSAPEYWGYQSDLLQQIQNARASLVSQPQGMDILQQILAGS